MPPDLAEWWCKHQVHVHVQSDVKSASRTKSDQTPGVPRWLRNSFAQSIARIQSDNRVHVVRIGGRNVQDHTNKKLETRSPFRKNHFVRY